jgi:hypothetical protein
VLIVIALAVTATDIFNMFNMLWSLRQRGIPSGIANSEFVAVFRCHLNYSG